MQTINMTFAVSNIGCGILFILVSIPLVKGIIPMNHFYGFRFAKSFSSEENWYKINRYGARQLIFWSSILVIIGLLYLVFPVDQTSGQGPSVILGTAPILICCAVAIWKTHLFAKRL